MAIATLTRVSLLGPDLRHQEILQCLQQLGCVHVIECNTEAQLEAPESSEQAAVALKYLQACPRQRLQRQTVPAAMQQDQQPAPLPQLVQQIQHNQQQRSEVLDQIELIHQHIRALRPWGNFRFAPLADMDGYRFWFYQVPLSQLGKLRACSYPWQAVAQDQRQHYVVVIAREEPAAEAVPFARVHTGDRCCAELHDQLARAQLQLEELDAEREQLTGWCQLLQHWLDEVRDCEERVNVARQRWQDPESDCFLLQAWVPDKALDQLRQVCVDNNVALLQEAPTPEDTPPILLDNPPLLQGAETVVQFFQLPGYRSWDPTPLVFFFFAFFFAMILSDAGYAAVLGGLLWLRWRRLGTSENGRRMQGLLLTILICSLIYGVLVGSYFGLSPPPESVVGWLQILNIDDFDAMMRLSLAMGVGHLLIANGMRALTLPTGFQRLSPWGWNLVIGAGFVVWLAYVKAAPVSWQQPAQLVMVLGALLVLLCSGQRVIARWRDVPLRLLDGIKALYNISKAFGDVLSYLRLFALGLASASLAITFNQLAVEARDSVDHGGFILFTLVLLAGHGLNLVLGIMSGVIHGLRLNLLEFYNWGVEGEGSPFKPIRKRGA